MNKHTDAVIHIQETINLLADMEIWEETAFLQSMHHGLQGDKRENRHTSMVDAYIRKYLMSEAMGMFGAILEPHKTSIKFPKTDEPLEHLKAYLSGLWDIYYKLHEAANKFVSPLFMKDLAKPLYDRASEIRKSIVMAQRDVDRYEAVSKHGTALHDLYRANNTAETKHDILEPKEEGMGFPG